MPEARYFEIDRGQRHRTPVRLLLPFPLWDRIRDLDDDERRLVKKIARGRMRGDRQADIACALGVSITTVRHLACVLGIPTTSEFRRRRVAKLHRLDLSAREVAHRMGITVYLANELRKDLGLPPFGRQQRLSGQRSRPALIDGGKATEEVLSDHFISRFTTIK